MTAASETQRDDVMRDGGLVNPTSEHELYLKLFISNGGGWCRST